MASNQRSPFVPLYGVRRRPADQVQQVLEAEGADHEEAATACDIGRGDAGACGMRVAQHRTVLRRWMPGLGVGQRACGQGECGECCASRYRDLECVDSITGASGGTCAGSKIGKAQLFCAGEIRVHAEVEERSISRGPGQWCDERSLGFQGAELPIRHSAPTKTKGLQRLRPGPNIRQKLPPLPPPRDAACARQSLSPRFPPAQNHSAKIPSSSSRGPGSWK